MICITPFAFFQADFFHKDVKFTCCPVFAPEIDPNEFVDKDVCKHNNLITSQGPATSFAFSFAIVEELYDREYAKQVAAGMLYRLEN